MDTNNFGSCLYYPCIKNKRLGVSACIGCFKYAKRNPDSGAEEDQG